MIKKIVCLAALTSTLAGCMPSGLGPKQTGGHIIGAAVGGIVGSQFGSGDGRLLAAGIGALAGTAIGGMIGHKMDQQDRALAQRAMMDTLERTPDHQSRAWKNPNNNHCGNFTVTRTQELPQNNLVCRDYVHTVIIDGRQEQLHGRACRDMRDRRGEWFVKD